MTRRPDASCGHSEEADECHRSQNQHPPGIQEIKLKDFKWQPRARMSEPKEGALPSQRNAVERLAVRFKLVAERLFIVMRSVATARESDYRWRKADTSW